MKAGEGEIEKICKEKTNNTKQTFIKLNWLNIWRRQSSERWMKRGGGRLQQNTVQLQDDDTKHC